MKKCFLLLISLSLLVCRPAPAIGNNNLTTLKSYEDYRTQYESLSAQGSIRIEVRTVFSRASSPYRVHVEDFEIDEWARAVWGVEDEGDNSLPGFIIVGWSEPLYLSLIYAAQDSRFYLEEINRQGNLTEVELNVLSLAKEMFEAATTPPALDELGAAILAYSKRPIREPVFARDYELYQYFYREKPLRIHALYLEFKKEMATPLPWPTEISNASTNSTENPTAIPIASTNSTEIPTAIPITAPLGGILLYHGIRKVRGRSKKIGSRIKSQFNTGDVLHTSIEPALVRRVVKLDNNRTLTVRNPRLMRISKIHGIAPFIFTVLDTAVATVLKTKQGVKTRQSTGKIAKNAGKIISKGALSYAGGFVGAKAGGFVGTKIGMSIGSVVPGAGTVVGGFAGGVIGSITGGMSGSGITCYLTDLIWS